ncbi:hypothetical protein CEXT_616831 [Caerostris extrusa]|uniref:Uncharacterized protein n=1 Tax=Caerostris extrusa TaxID=172846 RepID=A0AAV4MRL5_CAEEX|nr:hypothetical protein CEXT_616831 [Caerostris extrusa]
MTTKRALRTKSSSRVAYYPQLSEKHYTPVDSHPSYSPGLTPAGIFCVPNHRGDLGQCGKTPARHPRKCVPGGFQK